MKTIICTLLIVAAAITVNAAENVPPGLQKKGGLPPGQAKKHAGGAEESATTAATNAASISKTPAAPEKATPTGTAPAPAPSAKAIKADLDKHAVAVNKLDDNPAMQRAGYAAIARETGVTPKTIATQHNAFPGIGTAGLLIANEMAAQTKKPAINFLRAREEGRTWTQIAAEHKVDLEKVSTKMSHVQEAMLKAK